MKLSLNSTEDISLLKVEGSITYQDSLVLKAGLGKLFRSGKNRIIIFFEGVPALDPSVLREIAIFDITAKELAGKIVLATKNKELRKNILRFSKPPLLPIVDSVEAAMAIFSDKTNPTETTDAVDVQLEKDQIIKALQQKLKLMDEDSVRKLRAENTKLKTRITFLEKEVIGVIKLKRQPKDMNGFLKKIEHLEKQLLLVNKSLARK